MKINEEKLMHQTFQVLTGKATLQTLMEEKRGVNLLFNPYEPLAEIDPQVIDILIDFYVSLEEYEKCQKLVTLKEILFQ